MVTPLYLNLPALGNHGNTGETRRRGDSDSFPSELHFELPVCSLSCFLLKPALAVDQLARLPTNSPSDLHWKRKSSLKPVPADTYQRQQQRL